MAAGVSVSYSPSAGPEIAMTGTVSENGLSRPELWEAVANAELLDVEAQLRKKENLTIESARRLVSEYKRYLYLKTVYGGILTPSAYVDLAWHMHLNSDSNSWERFCAEVLQCRPEHKTGLSYDEAQLSYDRTFELYLREFKEEPPRDIWPGDAERKRIILGDRILLVGVSMVLLAVVLPMLSLAILLFFMGFSDIEDQSNFLGKAGAFVAIAGVVTIAAALIFTGGKDLDREASCG